jgi:hypothetical protein
MKACRRISIKDYVRNLNLKALLFRPPFPNHRYIVQRAGKPWPAGTTALRKALMKAISAHRPAQDGPSV